MARVELGYVAFDHPLTGDSRRYFDQFLVLALEVEAEHILLFDSGQEV
jgi:hypothetical protein